LQPLKRQEFAGNVPHVVLHRMKYSPEKQPALLNFVTTWVIGQEYRCGSRRSGEVIVIA